MNLVLSLAPWALKWLLTDAQRQRAESEGLTAGPRAFLRVAGVFFAGVGTGLVSFSLVALLDRHGYGMIAAMVFGPLGAAMVLGGAACYASLGLEPSRGLAPAVAGPGVRLLLKAGGVGYVFAGGWCLLIALLAMADGGFGIKPLALIFGPPGAVAMWGGIDCFRRGRTGSP